MIQKDSASNNRALPLKERSRSVSGGDDLPESRFDPQARHPEHAAPLSEGLLRRAFGALRPPGRLDAGTHRAFPLAVLEKAIAWREEQSARTYRSLVELWQRDPALLLSQLLSVHPLTTRLRRDPVTYDYERNHIDELESDSDQYFVHRGWDPSGVLHTLGSPFESSR